MSTLLERMTLWGKTYDQEVNAFRRTVDRASAKNELVDSERVDEYLTDIETLAEGAANLLSTLHALLDDFLSECDAPTLAVANLEVALTKRSGKVSDS